MKTLFLGGTGIIRTQLAVVRGFHVTLLNRGRGELLPGFHTGFAIGRGLAILPP